tara:strand:+ start:6208 stop:6804 length:597 start_codon:yes stop_codon:yes gene_type:complete
LATREEARQQWARDWLTVLCDPHEELKIPVGPIFLNGPDEEVLPRRRAFASGVGQKELTASDLEHLSTWQIDCSVQSIPVKYRRYLAALCLYVHYTDFSNLHVLEAIFSVSWLLGDARERVITESLPIGYAFDALLSVTHPEGSQFFQSQIAQIRGVIENHSVEMLMGNPFYNRLQLVLDHGLVHQDMVEGSTAGEIA